jgi:hypothetical protein
VIKRLFDFMYYVATPEFIAKWTEAKKGELICRMEKAIGGLPQYDSIEAMIAKMDQAGVGKVFITQCKMWSYRNKWMYDVYGYDPGGSGAIHETLSGPLRRS